MHALAVFARQRPLASSTNAPRPENPGFLSVFRIDPSADHVAAGLFDCKITAARCRADPDSALGLQNRNAPSSGAHSNGVVRDDVVLGTRLNRDALKHLRRLESTSNRAGQRPKR